MATNDAGMIEGDGLVLDHQVLSNIQPMKYGDVAAENGYFVPSADWSAISQERLENAKAAAELRASPGWGGMVTALALGLMIGYLFSLVDRPRRRATLLDL